MYFVLMMLLSNHMTVSDMHFSKLDEGPVMFNLIYQQYEHVIIELKIVYRLLLQDKSV